ncbi:hypothetical protein [Amycolatopsis sp. cg13]|uniref:hypothetical protein n=1 Tax=Amycolatopsis sp. cg13 TaxID=3238807 RepID=UPI003525B7CE
MSDLRAEIQAAVDEANKQVSHAESIKKFTVLANDFTEAGAAPAAAPVTRPWAGA